MASSSERTQSAETITVQVRFEGGDDVPILFANHVFVRSGPDGFIVSFAQSHGPYVVDTTLEVINREGVAAKIIARLLVPPNRMRQFAEIFQRLTEGLNARVEGSPNDNDTNDTNDTSDTE